MRLISRKVITSHSKEDVMKILRNANSRYYAGKIEGDQFHIMYPTRWHRQKGYIPVRGMVKEQNGAAEVSLEIHSHITVYVGLLIGVLMAAYWLITQTFNVFACLCCVGVVALVYLIALLDGIMCLDSLEHRLTCETGDSPVAPEETE